MTRAENIDAIIEQTRLLVTAFAPVALGQFALWGYMIKLQIDIITEQRRDREDRKKRQAQSDINSARIDKLEAGQ